MALQKKKGSNKDKTIVVAVIGLIGALGAAVISLLKTDSKSPQQPQVIILPQMTNSVMPVETKSKVQPINNQNSDSIGSNNQLTLRIETQKKMLPKLTATEVGRKIITPKTSKVKTFENYRRKNALKKGSSIDATAKNSMNDLVDSTKLKIENTISIISKYSSPVFDKSKMLGITFNDRYDYLVANKKSVKEVNLDPKALLGKYSTKPTFQIVWILKLVEVINSSSGGILFRINKNGVPYDSEPTTLFDRFEIEEIKKSEHVVVWGSCKFGYEDKEPGIFSKKNEVAYNYGTIHIDSLKIAARQ